ncbi:MAG: hypothetical protein GX764_04350 [Firmicutes bacterium]|nr:hypothetical protein [Bacillota bacterium]
MHLSTGHYLSIVFSLCIILIISFYARVKVKVSSDFTVGGHNAGILIVTGMFIGTFVGGSCSIGTAQLAFVYGLSAWWFTLGLGVSSLLLALFFAKPIHNTKLETVPQFLSSVYGKKTGLVSVVIMCTSLFITLVPQIISAAALFSTITGMLPVYGAALAVSMTACFIFFGGFWGAGMSGLYKTILLYGALVIGGILAFLWAGGWSGLRNSFPQFPWFSLFGRGIWKDLSGGISLLIGIITSQTTMQALSAATNEKTARLGALFAAFLIPPLG